MLHRKLLVGQRPSFPHRDLTLGSGHGVKTGLPCCLETFSLRAIYVYPFVLKEVKKKQQLPLTVFQLCGLTNDACNMHLKETWCYPSIISGFLVLSPDRCNGICHGRNCQNLLPLILKGIFRCASCHVIWTLEGRCHLHQSPWTSSAWV